MSADPSPVRGLNRDEIIVESTVKYWWQRRRFIAVTMSVFVLSFTAILFMIPKSYRAQASLIIMPPRFMPEIRTEPLTILSAKSLLETNELYQQVRFRLQRYRNILISEAGSNGISNDTIDRLSRLTATEISAEGRVTLLEAEAVAELDPTEIRGILEFSEEDLAELSVDRMGEILSSMESIEKKTASDIIYSPVLQLFAVSDTGPKAQVLVNTWARLFEEKYESLTRGQTERLFQSLEKQQDAGQEELEMIQKVLVNFSLENNLDLIERQITQHSNSYTSINAQLVEKTNKLTTIDAKIKSFYKLIASLEGQEMNWVGGLVVAPGTTETGSLSYETASNNPPLEAGEVIQRRRSDVLQNRDDLVSAYDAAAEFNAANPVELMEAELERLEADYLTNKTQYRWSLVKAEVARNTLAELNQTIAETSQSVALYTALPDEVLGDMLVSDRPDDARRIASTYLNKEQLNPLWQTLVTQHAEVSRDFYEAEAAVIELEKVLPEKETELQGLARKVFAAKQAEKLVDLRIDRTDKVNQQLFSDYSTIKEEAFDLGWDKTMLEDEIAALNSAAEKSLEAIESLRTEYESALAQKEVLDLRKKATLQRAELLTEKLQESMVAVREEVSDIFMGSKAVAPTRHFFPPRTILLAVLTLLTAVVLLGGLSRKRYLELAS